MKFNIWDFGGQEAYRNDYLTKLDEYLIDVDRLIYVIDAQDAERYELALKYFADLIKTMKNQKKQCDFSIFIHKCDPYFDMDHSFHTRIQNELINKIKKLISSNIKYKIFKTSVYTVFKKKLVQE